MEVTLMATVALDASPANVLRSFRGSIVDVHVGYSEVLHIEVKNPAGRLWRFATQDADYSPREAGALEGRSIESAEIDERSGELRCALSDGSSFVVKPTESGASDAPPNWELITPDGCRSSSARACAGRSPAPMTSRPDRSSCDLPLRPCENRGMTKSELHELVDQLPEDAVDGAAILLAEIAEGRIDPDQAWFWSREWLPGELEAEREGETEPGEVYEDVEAFKAALRSARRG
jgi:hypothetical protein